MCFFKEFENYYAPSKKKNYNNHHYTIKLNLHHSNHFFSFIFNSTGFATFWSVSIFNLLCYILYVFGKNPNSNIVVSTASESYSNVKNINSKEAATQSFTIEPFLDTSTDCPKGKEL